MPTSSQEINFQSSLSLSLSLSPPPSLSAEALLPALIQNRPSITSAHSSLCCDMSDVPYFLSEVREGKS